MSYALEIKDLRKSFGATEILRGVDLAVDEGECIALVGPNGAGKSTLFDAISGRTRPAAGAVLLGGRSIAGLAPQRIRRRGLSRSFQITRLFGTLDARDHLRCALAGVDGCAWRWLRPFARFGAAESQVARMLETLGLSGRADRPAASLAYADQRLLEIGLAFCGNPAVVLLDEPTAGMSQQESAHCTALIRTLAAGRTVLVVEHDMQVVSALADRIAVLAEGRVLAFDTPAAVRADRAVQQAYGGL